LSLGRLLKERHCGQRLIQLLQLCGSFGQRLFGLRDVRSGERKPVNTATQRLQSGEPEIRSHLDECLDSALHFWELLAGEVLALERSDVLLDVAQYAYRRPSY